MILLLYIVNDENFYLSERNEEIRENLSYDKIINNEMYPGEEIKVNKDDNLFLRKINLSLPLKNNALIKDLTNSIEFKKCKVDFLLKSLDHNESNKNENNNKNFNS